MANVSIITAGYSAKYLDGVWNSIKKQTHTNWEWILVCDNSIDVRDWYDDMNIKGEFDNYHVWAIVIGKNQGRFGLVSRNIGAMCASCNRIQFVDDDNELEEDDYLEEVLRVEMETGKIPYTKLHLLGKKPNSTYNRYKITSLSRHHIDLGNPLYYKKNFLKYGYFDDTRNRIMFDFDLIEKIINGEGKDNFIQVDRNLLFRHKRY